MLLLYLDAHCFPRARLFICKRESRQWELLGAQLVHLQAYAQSQFECQAQQQAGIVFGHLPSGENELGQTGKRSGDAAPIACAPLASWCLKPCFPQRSKVTDSPQFPVKQLASIVENEADMAGDELRREFWHLPAREVSRPAIVECRVVGDTGGQRLEEMLSLHTAPRIEVDVAVKDEAGLTRYGDRPSVDLPILHVALIHVLVVLGVEGAAGDLIETDDITLRNQAKPWRIRVADKQALT
jgi:hypothetical protein